MRTRGKSGKKTKKDMQSDKLDNIENCSQTKRSGKKLKKTADDIAESGRNQKKITSFLGISSIAQPATEPQQQSNSQQLRAEITRQDEHIKKLQIQKQMIENKYSKLYLQTKTYRIRSKQTLREALKTQYEFIRKQKGKIDQKLGYYTVNEQNNRREFVCGEYFQDLQRQINKKNQQIEKFEAQLKKSKRGENRERTEFAISFLKKARNQLEKQFDEKDNQLAIYKARLRLHLQERKCYFAQKNWPLIPDSNKVDRYQTLELIGKGGFGEVYRCFDIEQNEFIALKMINIDGYDQDHRQSMLKHAVRQINTQKSLKHPNIAPIKEIIQINQKRITFVLKFCEGPQLSKILRKQQCLEEKEAKQIIHQVFDAIAYLSSLDVKVIHYDLKPSNIMFDQGVVKILDFGLCKLMEGDESRIALTSQGAGTYWYLPPQAFDEDYPQITSKLDVWSAGVIFFQLLYGVKPFANDQSQKKVMKFNLITKQSKQLKFPDSNPKMYRVSSEAKQFIRQCLQCNPDDRISAVDAFQHSYFKS